MKKYIISLVAFLFVFSFVLSPNLSYAQTGDIDPNPNTEECISLENNLRYRDRDSTKNGEVSLLQDFLQSKGYLNSEPTGYFGILTFKAVKDFQRDNGINPTGYVGSVTRAKIVNLTCTLAEPLTPVNPPVNPPNTNFPPGCTSNQGYSVTTGVPCSGQNTLTPSITVLSPNGGEEWAMENSYEISWQANGINNGFEIYIKDDRAGPSYKLLKSGISNSSRTWEWIIPTNFWGQYTAGSSYKIQVREMGGSAGGGPNEGVFDESNNFFTITPRIIIDYLAQGDVNGDGLINCTDSTWITESVLQNRTLTAEQKKRADMNGDGNVTTLDGVLLSQRYGLNCGTTTTPSITVTLNTALSTPSQTIAVGSNGLTDGAKVVYNIKSSGGPVTITGLKYLTAGTYGAISSIRIVGVGMVPVDQNHFANFVGLNLQVPSGDAGLNVEAYLSYSGVGIAGVASGSAAQVQITGVTYTNNSNGVSTTINLSPSGSPIITLVSSTTTTPSITVLSPNNGGESVTAGQKIEVRWETKNVPAGSVITAQLNNRTSNFGISPLVPQTIVNTDLGGTTSNDGQEIFTIPLSDNPNLYGYGKNFVIQLVVHNLQNGSALSFNPVITDSSDNLFTINPPTQASCSLSATLAPDSASSTMIDAGTGTSYEFMKVKFTATGCDVKLTNLHITADSANTGTFFSNIQIWDGSNLIGGADSLSSVNPTNNIRYQDSWFGVSPSYIPITIANNTSKTLLIASGVPGFATGRLGLGLSGIGFNSNEASFTGAFPRGNLMTIKTLQQGDVNGDGSINCTDVTWIQETVLNTRTLTTAQRARADMNGDGNVTTLDGVLLSQKYGLNCGTTTEPLSVDLKINGSDNPSAVLYKSKMVASWTSKNAVTCNTFGSFIPFWDNSGVWVSNTLNVNLSTSGFKDLMAAGILNDDINQLVFSSVLQIGIQCWDKDNNSSTDSVIVSVNTPTNTALDSTPRIAYWGGKVGQHTDSQGNWISDPDGTSGVYDTDAGRLSYCKKWYPNTLNVSAYKTETITTWKRAKYYEQSNYTNTVMTYKCSDGSVGYNTPNNSGLSSILGSSLSANALGALDSTNNTNTNTNINTTNTNTNNVRVLVCGGFTKNLSKGMNSEEVRCLQQKLNEKGYKVAGTEGGKETTLFGWSTLIAVKAFQSSNGLVADGIFGLKTFEALN